MDWCFSNDTAIAIIFDTHSCSPQTRTQNINSIFLPWKEACYLKTKKAIAGEKPRTKVGKGHNLNNE